MRGLLYICVTALLVTFVSSQEPSCGPEDDFLPHPTDCNLYYACAGGLAVLNNCPEGLWWNTLTSGCDWPANVNCAAGSSSTVSSTGTTDVSSNGTSTTSTATSTGTTATSTGTTVTSTGTTVNSTVPTEPTDTTSTTTFATTTVDVSTEPPGGLPDSCPAVEDPNEVIRLPHESVCEYYYKCTAGKPVTFACSGNQQFSPIDRICRDPKAAGCDRCPTILDSPNQVTRIPHETDCHLYYLCSPDATSVIFQCRLDLHFSRNVRECLSQEQAKCVNA